MFTIPCICLNCAKMLPAVIRAELNYIRAGSCVATPSVCLYRSHTHFFLLLFTALRCCCLFLFSLTSPLLKGRCPKSIAFTQFISAQVNTAEWNGGTCMAYASWNGCSVLLINNTTDRHQVQWKGTESKHYCWITDNSMLHSPEQQIRLLYTLSLPLAAAPVL